MKASNTYLGAIERKPPHPLKLLPKLPITFVAGSIEMGNAPNWQSQFRDLVGNLRIILLNPRRDFWDEGWRLEKENPMFRRQVEWEQAGLRKSDLIVFYFAPGTNSPLTLLELGLFACSGKCVVCCPKGFSRKGTVDIICEQNHIPQVDTITGLADFTRERFEKVPEMTASRRIYKLA